MASKVTPVTPQSSSSVLDTGSGHALNGGGKHGGKVFPSSPINAPIVSAVPVSPTAPAVTGSTVQTVDKTVERALSAVSSPAHSEVAKKPSTARSDASMADRLRAKLEVNTDVAVTQNLTSPTDNANQGSTDPNAAAPLLSSPRKKITMTEVVSAKAVASRKRRGTVESTEIREGMDAEGRKVVNQ